MEFLEKYPDDFVKSFRPSFNFLSRSNISFLNNNDTCFKKYWRFIYMVPCVALLYATSAIHICKMLSQEQIFVLAYLLPPLLVCTQAIIKTLILIANTSEVTAIIEELASLWRTTNITETQDKEKAALLQKLHFCNGVLYWMTVLGSLQYIMTPLLETLIRRSILHQECELLLPISCSFPLGSTNNWLMYIGIYMFQIYSTFLCVFVYVGAELFMITLCALLGIEFTLLREDLQHLTPGANKTEARGEVSEVLNNEYTIKDFVMRHQRLIELSRKLDKVFNPMIFFNLFFVGITACFFRYAAQFSRGPTYMINNYVSVLFSLQQVLYLCYYGELLTGASAGIGDAAYQNLWYKGGTHYQKTIYFIIKRSQTPCCLTSMRYARVDLNMFTKVISTTWSYFSLMSSVYGEEV